jgi:hemolysin activation/secretion protein
MIRLRLTRSGAQNFLKLQDNPILTNFPKVRPCRLVMAACSLMLSSVSIPAIAQQSSLPTRQQIELPDRALPPPINGVKVSQEARRPLPCPFDANELSLRIETINFIGVGGMALPVEISRELAEIRPSNEEVSISQLCDLRDAAVARLSASGYIAAVTIPPQEIRRDSRAVTLIVIPARLVDIEIVGVAGKQAKRVLARADRLKAIYPLRTSDLERELLLASDIPGLNVKMALASAGSVPGEMIGRLEVSERAFEIVANAQNFGSAAIGRELGSFRAEFYGLTGLSDVTFIGASSTGDFEEQWTLQAGHYLTLDSGLTLGGSILYAESRPGIGALDLRSNSLLGAIEASMPLVRALADRLTIGGGLELIDQESDLQGGAISVPLTRDRLRVAFVELQGSHRKLRRDGRETFSLDGVLELRHGLNILGASERGEADGLYLPSNLEGDPTAFVVRGGLTSRVQQGRFALLARVEGQYSANPLLSFEKYAVGNFTIGRGYDPASTLGDSALGARLQPSIFVPAGKNVIEPYAFVDAVRIWNKDTFTTENGRTLASAGLGARLYVANRFVLDAAWAHPFDKPINLPGVERAPDRLLVSFTASFGPKGR